MAEIQNDSGDQITLQRAIKGRSSDLITVHHGGVLTQSSTKHATEDFYVSRPGAATREKGFHRYLAEWLGLQLPPVHTYEGRVCPLYLQYLFPYFFVEQTRGWASLEPPLPQYRVREPHKRAIEYILRLDAYRIAMRRLGIREEEALLQAEWGGVVRQLRTIAKMIGGTSSKLQNEPVVLWPPDPMPGILLPRNDTWLPIHDSISECKQQLRSLQQDEIPRVSEVIAHMQQQLRETQENLLVKESLLERLLNQIASDRGEFEATQDRLAAIEEDIQRNNDARILKDLGGNAKSSIVKNECPTCHQNISDTLLPLGEGQSVMTIEENIAFLQDQKKTFGAVLLNFERILEARELQAQRLREEIAEARSSVRTLRETLVSDGRAPSRAAIKREIDLEQSIYKLVSAEEDFNIVLEELAELSAKWKDVQTEKVNLPRTDISDEDRSKLSRWGQLLLEQMEEYAFESLPCERIGISEETYRATHEGFDLHLPSNISASDFIRIIWSYLLGMLELARTMRTNHLGLLVFDEPRQQSTKPASFQALFRRASEAKESGQQVIFATSEDRNNLRKLLAGIDHTYIEFEGHMIKPLA